MRTARNFILGFGAGFAGSSPWKALGFGVVLVAAAELTDRIKR